MKALREEIAIPVHFHTHDTSGINSASVLKAADAGVDVADAAIAAMSGGTSQPNLNSIVEALRHTPRDTNLDVEALNECSDYWETVRTYYLPFDSGPKAGSARLYQHEIPGGQYTNLREQAAAMGLGHRWREVEKMYAEVNQLFGDIVKVTPSSKVVGDMTLFLMANEMQPADLLKLDEKHDLSLPNSVVEMFSGVAGRSARRMAHASCKKLFCAAQPRSKAGPAQAWKHVDLAEACRQRWRKSRSHGAARRPFELSALSGCFRKVSTNFARPTRMSAFFRRPRFIYGLSSGRRDHR